MLVRPALGLALLAAMIYAHLRFSLAVRDARYEVMALMQMMRK